MNNENIIPAVEKAVLLLERLGRNNGGATQAELAGELGITGSTCYRIIQTLQKYDWLRKTPGNRYELSGGMLSAAMKLVNPAARFERCQPLLDMLANRTGLSVKLSVRQGSEQITILRAESPRATSVSGRVGARFPVVEGSVGAALLCHAGEEEIQMLAKQCREAIREKDHPELIRERIEDLHRNGYCLNARLNRWKVDAMSIPLGKTSGQTEAALTLLGFDDDFPPERLDQLAAEMKKTGKACMAAISG